MGMFDEVTLKCPYCGHHNVEQSKAGPCNLNNYTIETAPNEVCEDLSERTLYCSDCGHQYHVVPKVITFSLYQVSLHPKPNEIHDE